MPVDWRLLILLSACLGLTSCGVSVKPGYIDDDKKAAQQATAHFHALYNDQQYSQMYAESHQLLRRALPESAFVTIMKANRETELGRFERVIESKENVVFGSPSDAVEVRSGYHTKYEKGEVTEYFAWILDDKKATLGLYKGFHGTLPLDDPGPSPSPTPTRQKL